MGEITTGRLADILTHSEICDVAEYRTKYLTTILTMSFSEYYLSVLGKKEASRNAAVANSGIEVHYAYQILSGDRNPKRDKMLCLCIGGGFSVLETNRALERAKAGCLYPKRLRDAIIMLALNKNINVVWRVNELLSENDQELLS
ncbi:MAG: hypothetical protein VB078_02505 [Clostridiaceae bacterium]|nr:hypothetical protein [Clostridiaceae bacterium]